MDPQALEALKASIEKWEANVKAVVPEQATVKGKDCPLCDAFYKGTHCGKCPVKVKTKEDFCIGTPYRDAVTILDRWHQGALNRDKWQAIAQAEVDFLRSLLPEGETCP